MTALDRQRMQAIERNFSSVVNFLERNLSKPSVNLSEVPCYFYMGNNSKLEVTVFSNPRIAKIDVRMIKLKNYDREPFYEYSYDLDGLSMPGFQKAIDNLMSQIN